jgi:hypothetical protein
VTQPPPGHVRYAEAYPPDLRYLYQVRAVPRRRAALKVALSVVLLLVVLFGVLGYVYVRPILVEYPATLSTPDSVAGMPRLIDERLQEVSDQMTASVRTQSGVDQSMAAFYSPDGTTSRAVLVFAGTRLLLDPSTAVREVFAGFGARSGLAVTGVTSVSPGGLGGVVRCGETRISSGPLSLCVWGDHGSLGVVLGFGRGVPETADLLRTARPLVLHR